MTYKKLFPILGLLMVLSVQAKEKEKSSKTPTQKTVLVADHVVTVNTNVTGCLLSVDTPTGIEGFRVWPNPLENKQGIIQFPANFDKVEVSVVSLTGKVVQQQTVYKNNPSLSLTKLSIGMYLVKFKHEKNTAVYKLIID
ncbi:T9SS type A sorting domain-containing protein [Aquimarina brevivitae]|uniref:Putative secreted protein (Por secretion system target) n=1 Tax=Aquimarina brevivitae TaxID=323412 RepID=A0A4Q7NXU4_9FLAO|nr:T9SS type A sorting domain-containing protein [Aquimarina brevivitae]RZS92226.1 putative secreted protein (Por secretion system target) [Aquimarina brevivitae]